MTTTDVRLFMEVTTRQAEEAFRRQMEESNRRIEAYLTSAHVHSAASQRHEASTQPRELWWSQGARENAAAAGQLHSEGEKL